jgi:ATP-dependent Clp protease ATP-binding subunit ClpA
MSEMSEKNSVAKWVGAAAGYVGYEEGGQLVEQIAKNPHSVLLLDEIEKASPDVFNVLLGVMDNASLTDSHGKTADFSNVVVVMTSNVGAHRIGEKALGFGGGDNGGKTNVEAINQEYEKTFSPEFRNRVDALVVFNDLSKDDLRRIVDRELVEFREQLADKNVECELTEAAYDWLVKNGYSEKLGARPLVRLFEKEVKDRTIDPVLFGDLKDGGKATIDVESDHLVVLVNAIVGEPVKVTSEVKE